ncbi:phage tail protein [Virgibacillus oceani]
MHGITFDGKHSYRDFGIMMAPGKEIGIPEKKKIKVAVPFSNEEYDFSELYGSQAYDPRPLTYLFNIWDTTKDRMSIKKTKIVNWLMSGSGKKRLYDDAIPGYYFLAEVEGQSFAEDWQTGVLTANFTAYPFMISELKEGHDIWDKINFELDVLQPVEFNVNGTLEVTLYNVGKPSLTPKITASNSMTLRIGNRTFNVPSGESQSRDFVLNPGENDLVIEGNGSISFEFYKELI